MTTTTNVDIEAVEDFQKRVAQKRARLETLVEWHLNAHFNGGLELPYMADETYISVTKYHDYPLNEHGNPDYSKSREIDVEATTQYLAKVVRYLRSLGLKVEKRYTDDNFSIITQISSDPIVRLTFVADRNTVCTKRVVGTKVIPAETTPERIVEEVEWDCNKVSFLGMETS